MKIILETGNFLILFFLMSIILNAQVEKSSIKLEITGFSSDEGNARITIFSSKEKEFFPKVPDKAYLRKIVSITDNKVILELEEIPMGEYAISVHHDENNDGKVNRNWIGIPNEGLGCSNGATGFMGPPSYEKAKFFLLSKSMLLKIKINY